MKEGGESSDVDRKSERDELPALRDVYTKALGQLEGIKNVQVDLAKGEVRFDNSKEIALSRVEKAISDAGYQVIPS